MSETKFTKGDWQARKGFIMVSLPLCGEAEAHIIDGPDNMDIAYLPKGYPNSKANAHLIAAAPELYEALEAMVKITETYCDEPDEVDVARAALAKARGEG